MSNNPWLDLFLGNTTNNPGLNLLNSPRTSGLGIPSMSSLVSPINAQLQALIAQFPDVFSNIVNGTATDTAGTGTTATSGPNGAEARSGGRMARVPNTVAPANGGGRGMRGGMNGYPMMRRPMGGGLGAALNTAPVGGGFTGMVDRLREADRMARQADRQARRAGTANSNANGGTVRMGNVDPNAHINVDVSGGTDVERAQRARRSRY